MTTIWQLDCLHFAIRESLFNYQFGRFARMSGLAGGSRSFEPDNKFETFITEVKEIEKRDSVLTPKQQIDRLLRPGSTYFNLNPFEVLQIDPTLTLDQIKKRYRSLSLLVHPDKNQDDRDRAQNAFEAVNRAWKVLENDLTRSKCMELYEEAKGRTDLMVGFILAYISLRFSCNEKYPLVDCREEEEAKERGPTQRVGPRRGPCKVQQRSPHLTYETVRRDGEEATAAGHA